MGGNDRRSVFRGVGDIEKAGKAVNGLSTEHCPEFTVGRAGK
jgi:hypothetical protein